MLELFATQLSKQVDIQKVEQTPAPTILTPTSPTKNRKKKRSPLFATKKSLLLRKNLTHHKRKFKKTQLSEFTSDKIDKAINMNREDCDL